MNKKEKTSKEFAFVEVYCPKEKKKVPVWYCTGSFTQNRKKCQEWSGQAEIDSTNKIAKVLCMYEEVMR